MKSIIALAALIFVLPANARDEHASTDRHHSNHDQADAHARARHADAAYDRANHADASSSPRYRRIH